MKRVPELDGVRGIAILLVLVWHFVSTAIPTEAQGWPHYLAMATRLTWSGVDLFFVLSGFLIVGILIDHRKSANYFQVFYLRRICRIFPLYYALLAGFVAVLALAPAALQPLYEHPLPLVAYATFTQNFVMAFRDLGAPWMAATWSLAVEEQFYLLIPLLVRVLKPTHTICFLVAGILLSPFLRMLLPHPANFILCFTRGDSLLLGGLLAYVVRNIHALRALQEGRTVYWVALFFFLLGAGFLTWREPWPGSAFGHFWLSLLYGLVVLAPYVVPHSGVCNVLRSPVLVWFGLRSYALYVFHKPAAMAVFCLAGEAGRIRMQNASEALLVLAGGILTMALAEISYRVLEGPILAWGHRFRYKPLRTTEGSGLQESP